MNHVLNPVRHPLSICGLLCALLALASGCQLMSQAAYSVASLLDPQQFPCINHVGNCALCGNPPPGTEPGVVPASYTCPQCGAAGPPNGPAPADVMAQLEKLQADTTACREQMAEVNTELQQRGQMLVQTRGELARVQNDVTMLRSSVAQWQSSMHQLHVQIREREAERNDMVNAMLSEVKKALDTNEVR